MLSRNTPQAGLVRRDTYAQTFTSGKVIKLPNGKVAKQIWMVTRADEDRLKPEQLAQARSLDTTWQPKVVKGKTSYGYSAQMQRCPPITVDNFVFLYQRGMREPLLVIGEWKKDGVKVWGRTQTLHGVVVPAGGHYEIYGDRPDTLEPGHTSLTHAANSEALEELKLPKDRMRATQMVCGIDDLFNDPRKHCLRFVYLRWVEVDPATTEEIKSLVAIPVSQLNDFCADEIKYTNPKGETLPIVLNHDDMIRTVMALPDTHDFLAKIIAATEEVPPGLQSSSFRTFS